MTLKTRPPTGRMSWPSLLLAGTEGAGKSYQCALVSASDRIGRTLWLSFGEQDPDELGALKGARFEIVEHDGTYRGLLTALEDCLAEPPVDGKPNLLVFDSLGRAWDLLTDQVQAEAVNRARRRRGGNQVDEDSVKPTMDLWNLAKQRWQHIVQLLRSHQGPVLVTARLEVVTVVEDGQPTKDRIWKVKAEKTLPFDVDVIVEMRSRVDVALVKAKTLAIDLATQPDGRVPLPDFTIEGLWRRLGVLDGDLGQRHYVQLDPERSAQVAEREAAASQERAIQQESEAEEIASLRDALDHARRRHKWSWEQVSHDFEATRGMPPGEASLDERRRYVAELNSGPAGRAPREPQLEPQATTGGGLGDGAAAGVADGGGDVGGARGVGAGEGDPGPAGGGGDTGQGHGGSGDVAGGPEAGGDRGPAGGDGVAVGADGAGGGGRRRRPAAAREGDVA